MATPIVVNAEKVKTSSSNPPPNVSDGGVWGTLSYVGEKTKVAAFCGFLCFCLPGCLILCCPFDEKDAYSINNKIYDASGTYLGSSSGLSFVPTRPK